MSDKFLKMPEFLTEEEQDFLNDYYNSQNGTSQVMNEATLKRYVKTRRPDEVFLTWGDIHKRLTAIRGEEAYVPGKVAKFVCSECNKVKNQSECHMPGSICTDCKNKEKQDDEQKQDEKTEESGNDSSE